MSYLRTILFYAVFFLSLTTLLTSCSYQTLNKKETVQSISLNGDWKFNHFLGDGSNYRNIEPTSSDIIVDNADTDLIEVQGNWSISQTPERASQMWGEDYLKLYYSELNANKYVRFHYPQLQSGYYEHFIFYPFGISLHSQAKVKHAEGIETIHISQRNRPGRWISLGIYKIDDPEQSHIEVNTASIGLTVADAIMLRPVNTQTYLTAQQQKQAAYLTATNDQHWQNLKVPGHWGMLNEYSTYTGKAWYRKTFKLPQYWQNVTDEKIRIQFDGVYHIAKVYLNGQYIGRHQGGFTPFEFDITDKLHLKKNNVLAVEADNSAIVGATWNWGGIIRDVKLTKTADVRINYQYIHADPDLSTGNASIKLKVRVENNSNRQRLLTFQSNIFRNVKLMQLSKAIKIPAQQTLTFELTGQLTQEQVNLWHFDSPNLYQMHSQLIENDQVIHQSNDRFGIRKIELTENQMLLNGEPVRLGGFNRVSDHRYWGSSEPLEILEQDVELMKNAGANFMRIMHGTQNKKLLELCDEKGILLFEEANIRELTNPEIVPPHYDMAKQWVREMVERDSNHPSIIGWSVGNELSYHYDYAKEMIHFVKTELDSYRLVTNVSNTGYRDHETPKNDPLGLSDLMMQNIYQNNPEQTVLALLHHKWPDKPLFISEYGLGRFKTPSLDNDYPNFNQWHQMIRGRNTHVVGTAIWTFNDYRSGYSQSLESENRAWGVVNAWRQKRRAYQTVQQGLSPIKVVKLMQINEQAGQANLLIEPRGLDDYPSYTMRDYQLVWQIFDSNGQVIEEHTTAMPTLKPDGGHWQSPITWQSSQDKIAKLTVKILSTNGFTRYVKNVDFKVPTQPNIEAVIAGKHYVRILFNKVEQTEYQAVITSPQGKTFKTEKTIDPYIDIPLEQPGASYQVALIASNNKGESEASLPINTSLSTHILPPYIWQSMIRDNKLIIGFTGSIEDKGYQLRYGEYPDKLSNTAWTSGRGMITADIDNLSSVYFQLRRVTEDEQSEWTPVRQQDR
ncbi:glycoside hydrolase family 2 TIM barrel-domain containing protein [Thalassotalea agariperforans]